MDNLKQLAIMLSIYIIAELVREIKRRFYEL